MNARILTLLGLFILSIAVAWPAAGTEQMATTAVDLVLTGADFGDGELQGVVVTPDGLALSAEATIGQYVSPVIEAPIAYNALVPQWMADVPESASMSIRLRTGSANDRWSDWHTVAENRDWMLPDDLDMVGQMITVPATDVTHDKLQISVGFSRYEGTPSAVLEQLRLTLIDSSRGPSAAEMAAHPETSEQQESGSSQSGYPKPAVIPRTVWCDPIEGSDCTYSDGLEYEPVTHLIVHHTVSNNANTDWAAVVRAIWRFHTYTRGWGDIGYNYLVDPNGVIYEGHFGGDDVVGTHAAGANAGSMALAFLGTFTTPSQNPPGIPPPAPMLDSAAELFAWKADQKNINVFDASHLPDVSWGLPHLMGHRDVYGTTVCPGDLAHELLPWLRSEVASRIGFVSPHIYIDELSSAFTRSNSIWHVPPGGCGFNGHAYYTWSTTDAGNSTNWGEWRPSISEDGLFEVEVYAPYCITGTSETHGATYTVTDTGGTSTVVVSHEANVGTWTSLGIFNFAAGNSGLIRLTDLTTTDSDRGVWFDAIRLRPFNPPTDPPTAANAQPSPGARLGDRTVNFSWSVNNGGSVNTTRIDVAQDEDFDDLVHSESFFGTETEYTHTFDQDYPLLYWRIVLTTWQNQTVSSPPTWFGIDTTAPTSAVGGIFLLEDGRTSVHWGGEDASGIVSYNVDYRAIGETEWIRWLSDTSLTGAAFDQPDNRIYSFRSQATDVLGNMEAPHENGDRDTSQAIQLYRAIMFPLSTR